MHFVWFQFYLLFFKFFFLGKLVGAGAGNCVAFGGGGARPASNANHTYGDVDVYCVIE